MRIKNKEKLYFILSILVIFAHCNGYFFYVSDGIEINKFVLFVSDYLIKYLYKIAVPIFLFFSGLLFYRGINTFSDLVLKIKKRIFSVYIPYFAWNIISIVWSYVITLIPFIKNNINYRDMFVPTIDNIIKGIFFCEYNKHFWFMLALCIYIAVSPAIYLMFKNKKIASIGVITILILYFLNIKLPIEIHMDSFVYYIIGSYFGRFYYNEILTYFYNKNNKKKIYLYILFFIASEVMLYITNEDRLITLIVALASYSFLMIFNTINDESKHCNVYNFYFMNYCMHFIVQPCVSKLIWIFLPHNSFFALFNVLGGTAITILIIYFISVIIKKYFKYIWIIISGEKYQID